MKSFNVKRSIVIDGHSTSVSLEGGREDRLEQFVDDGIRRRFGEVISRACGRRGKQIFPASENDYVELTQAHLLRRR
jgi:hypothetical protein